MGKKSQKKKNKAEQRKHGEAIQIAASIGAKQLSDQNLSRESQRLLALIDKQRSLDDVTSVMRQLLSMADTDHEINDNDPYGDGDQKEIGVLGMAGESTRQVMRHVWGRGGDMEWYLIFDAFTPLAYSCAIGNPKQVNYILRSVKDFDERKRLLEKRETGMRVPPLILTIALSKCKLTVSKHTGVPMNDMDHLGVARVLLRYGARPDSKEVAGKTVCHYGSGSYAKDDTLAMVDYCAEAVKTSSYFGKEVVLKNLSNDQYNNVSGRLGGFVAETGRRQIILPSGKELAIKPQNIFDRIDETNDKCIIDESINLVDIPDRLGQVCLHEVIMGSREDVATFLCEKHNPSLDIECRGGTDFGTSIRKMAYNSSYHATPVQLIVRKYAERKSEEHYYRCKNCDKRSEKQLVCSRCRNAYYCSAKCQRENWKVHKKICKDPRSNELKLINPKGGFPSAGPETDIVNIAGTPADGTYKKPKGVSYNEYFWLKVQVDISSSSSLLLYDKTRTCTFVLRANDVGFDELLEKVKAEKGANGSKCHVEALFDEAGDCKVYPSTATLLKW